MLALLSAVFLFFQVNGALITTTYPGPVITTSRAAPITNSPCNIVSQTNLPVTVTTSCGTVTAYLLDRADYCEQVRPFIPGSPGTTICIQQHYPWSRTVKLQFCTPTYTVLTQTINVGSCTANVDYMRVSTCTCAFPSQLNLGIAGEANVYTG